MTTRLSRLEGSYEQIAERLNDLSQTIQGVDRKVDALRSDLDVRFESMRSDVDARIESVRTEMDARFREVDTKIDRLGHRVYIFGAALWATLAAGLFAIAAGFIS